MLLKYLILFSFLNFLLAETYSIICIESNDTINYESIFNKCCKIDLKSVASNRNNKIQVEIKTQDDCCADYDQNFNYVTAQFVFEFKCKDCTQTGLSSEQISKEITHFNFKTIYYTNIFKQNIIKTSIIRI